LITVNAGGMMALVREIKPVQKERHSVHGPTDCSSSIFRAGGKTYLQLDTYGAAGRKYPEKVSQSLQFDAEAAAQLKGLLEEAFPHLK
jgi:hypothetical protein